MKRVFFPVVVVLWLVSFAILSFGQQCGPDMQAVPTGDHYSCVSKLIAPGTVMGNAGSSPAMPAALTPSQLSDLGFGPAPSTTTPLIDGVAAIGSSTTYARADHVHPSEISRAIRAGGFAVMFLGANAAAGVTEYVTIPYACTITDWVITGDSTATVKLWRVADGGTALPTVSNSISTSGFGLSTGTRIHSTTLSDLSSTAIAAYDTFGVNLSAYGGSAGHVEFTLGCQR